MLEIELKAWADLDAARARLEALGKKQKKRTRKRPIVKEDVYYCAPEADPRACDPGRDRVLRVRVEDGEAILTAKRKRLDAGIETNEEIELAVADPDALRRLIDYLGYTPFIVKRKETRAWKWAKGVVVELNRVDGLGDFVEVEALLADDATPPEVAAARACVRSVVDALGMGDRVEPRLYVDLLRERGKGPAPPAPAESLFGGGSGPPPVPPR